MATEFDVEELNDQLARTHPIDDYYARSPLPIRWIERKRLRIIRAMVGASDGLDLLEVGSGGGHILRMFPSARLTAIDVSDVYLDVARENLAGYDVRFIKGEVDKLDLPPAGFDRIICSEVLEHTVDPEAILATLARLLRPEGVAVITIPERSPDRAPEGVAPALARRSLAARSRRVGRRRLPSAPVDAGCLPAAARALVPGHAAPRRAVRCAADPRLLPLRARIVALGDPRRRLAVRCVGEPAAASPSRCRAPRLALRWLLAAALALGLAHPVYRAGHLGIEYFDGYDYLRNARALAGDPLARVPAAAPALRADRADPRDGGRARQSHRPPRCACSRPISPASIVSDPQRGRRAVAVLAVVRRDARAAGHAALRRDPLLRALRPARDGRHPVRRMGRRHAGSLPAGARAARALRLRALRTRARRAAS